MTLAWKSDMPSGRKFVLVSLCDNANDQGECFPSISTIAERCSMGERTVQGHVHDLIKTGILLVQERAGRSNVYTIDPRRFCTPIAINTPADPAPPPPQISHPTPADPAPPPPQISHPTPADSAPITIKEPSIEPKGNQRKAQAPLIPDWVPVAEWNGFVEMRKKIRKPMTDRAVELKVGELLKFKNQGFDIAAILDKSTSNNWTDIYAPKEKFSAPQKPSRHAGFQNLNYSEGVNADGTLA